MLKIIHISGPNGGLDPHVAQGRWKSDVDICPYIQELEAEW